MATPISAEAVRRIFAHLETGSGDRFFAHVAEDVDWTVQGTHPLAGHYTSKQDFHAHTFARLNKILPSGTQLHVEQVFTDGDWAIVELRSLATAKNGMRFDNHYCWVMRIKNEMIVEVRAYLDSALVQKLIDQNPAEERSARRGQSTKPAPSRDALFTFFLTIDEGDKKK